MSSNTSLPPYILRFNTEGKVFTCYNCDTISSNSTNLSAYPATPAELPLLDDYSPRYLCRLNFQHVKYPYLPFIPVNPETSGPILGRFAEFKLDEDENGFSLNKELIEAWLRLGNAITNLSKYLWEKKGFEVPIKLIEYTRPEQYGYMFKFHTKEEALQRITDSRQAFLPLFAMFAFIVALYEFGPEANPEALVPRWFLMLVHKQVNPNWLDDLRSSQVADFGHKRVGVILDFSVASNISWWTNYLHIYIKAGIPVYINWGLLEEYVPPTTFCENLRPTSQEFRETKLNYELWLKGSRKASNRIIGQKSNVISISVIH